MPTAAYGVSLSVGGVSIQKTVNRTGDHPNSYEVTLPVGYAGSLTTRTDDNTGTITLNAGHAITTGMTVDIHWATGVQYKVTVGTVTVNSMPFDLGIGDNLPAQATAVVVTPQVNINTAIDGDNVQILAICAEAASTSSTAAAHIDMLDSGAATIEEIDLVANVPRVWDIAGGDTNVFTGNPITASKASNGSSTEVLTLKIASLEDSTP